MKKTVRELTNILHCFVLFRQSLARNQWFSISFMPRSYPRLPSSTRNESVKTSSHRCNSSPYSSPLFPLRKSYAEQMFLLRTYAHATSQPCRPQTVKRSQRWKGYAIYIYTVLNLECWKCARTRFHCGNCLAGHWVIAHLRGERCSSLIETLQKG